MKKIEVTWSNGNKTIEQYNPEFITAEQAFNWLSGYAKQLGTEYAVSFKEV